MYHSENQTIIHHEDKDNRWWRDSVIYQVYPKSFKDSNNDGLGDLNGITAGIPDLSTLGVDALWLSPFYKSPQKDGGYDVTDYCVIDPLFGTIEDFDNMLSTAHQHNLKVIIDIVPNHCSIENELFKKAVQSPVGSSERDMFIFRDGTGDNGNEAPNDWKSHFEGSAWARLYDTNGNGEQWYLHLFDSSQPDWNWRNPAVHAEFERILRFWLNKGVNGFRVDVAHALIKKDGLPNWGGAANGFSIHGWPGSDAPMFGQPEVHDIYKSWREILDSYDGDRILCAEANVESLDKMALWVRDDEMHQAFNFPYMHSGWHADNIRLVISQSFDAFDEVGAPTTWVLSNHDGIRHASRFGLEWHGDGIGPNDTQPNAELGLQRARASSLFMLALPGGAYLYQGEELGLPDNTMIQPAERQDPSFIRSGGERIGRDGCRVPLPWDTTANFGFSANKPWLPQPENWDMLSRESQEKDSSSTLSMYRNALAHRKSLGLGKGSFAWSHENNGLTVSFLNKNVLIIMNMGMDVITVPLLPVIASSGGHNDGILDGNSTVWLDIS